MTAILKKTMPRPLTEGEKEEMRLFLSRHQTYTVPQVVEFFERRLGIPITETCVLKRIIEMSVPEVGKFNS